MTLDMRSPNKRQQAKGVTLIELIITISIISILAGLSYPAYLDYIQSTYRDGAQGGLEILAAEMAKAKTTSATNNFAGLATDAGAPISTLFPSQLPLDSETKTHNITISINTAGNQFTLTATPISGTTMENDGTLTLSSTGAKTWNGESGWD